MKLMADSSRMPEGLGAVLQRELLPRLSLAGLQSLAQTCSSTKHLVMTAQLDAWTTASQRDKLPASLFETASTPYSTAAKLAGRHAAVKAGPACCRTVHGHVGNSEWGNTAFAALQPDFAELVSTRMSHVFVSPMHPTADTGQARCFSPTRFSGTSFHLADLWYGEQQCAPDGQHFVAINCCAAWDNHGYGLSLFAAKPALRVVETYDLAAMGKEAFWSPNSKLFCVLAEGTGYVCSVPGRQTYPAHMRELPASPLIDCFWSPCSTLIAAGCTQQSRLIICARDGVVLSKILTADPQDAWYNPLRWITLGSQLCMVFNKEYQATVKPDNEVQLQTVRGLAFTGTFPSAMFMLQIGYRTLEGYRVAGLTETGWKLVLHDLTTSGLVSPVSTQGITDCSSVPYIAWAPNDSLWLAMLSIVQVDVGDFDIHVARLQILDGRSGQVVSETVLAESSFVISPGRLEWSASGQGLLVGLEFHPDLVFAYGGEYTAKWMKKYFRFM